VGSIDIKGVYHCRASYCQEFIIAESLSPRGEFFIRGGIFPFLIAGSIDIRAFIITGRVLFAEHYYCRASFVRGA